MDNAQGRAVRPRSRGTAWARRAITLAVLAAGIWNATASRAEAGPAPIVRQFTCPLPVIGSQSMTLSVVPPDLDTATVGVPTPRLPITATATFVPAARTVVSFLGAEWAEGSGVMTGEVDTSQERVKESVPFTVPRTDVATGSGPLSVSGSGTLPAMTFSRSGDGEVLVTGLTVHFSLLTSDGGQTWLSPFNITCTLASGQSSAVESFRVLPVAVPASSLKVTRGTATSSPTPRPPRPTSPTSHTTRPTPSPVTSSPAPPPSPTPTPPRKPSPRVPYLLWPVGIVSVGGLGGLAWWLQRRMSA